jgi:type IV pilus assembly protein PilM
MSNSTVRPELACEIVPQGVIAARRQPDSALLASAAFAAFGPDAPRTAYTPYIDKDAPRVAVPGMHTGDPHQRDAVVRALKNALEQVGGRNGALTLVIPDTAVRVLFLDFDSLPSKPSEAIPIIRFRLRKMVAFEVDDAAIGYQAMPAASGVRVVAAALPQSILQEYESMVREAGFEPGVVLPSTMATLGMLPEDQPALVVKANSQAITTAIVRGQEVLLYRTQELAAPSESAEEAAAKAALPQEDDPEEMLEELESEQAAADRIESEAIATQAGVETDLLHALSVATAFYEDTIGGATPVALVAGELDTHFWQSLVNPEEISLRDMVTSEDMGTATDSGLSRAQLAAVCGALRG